MSSLAVNVHPTDISTVKEGSAIVKFSNAKVFYNPVQQFNRDLSIAVITTFSSIYLSEHASKRSDGLKIVEALSASGLRSIRYGKEIPNVSKIIANDLDPKAVEAIRSNIELNSQDSSNLTDVVSPNQGDANSVLFQLTSSGFVPDVIDIDPYGSSAPFIDAAVQNVADGGLLCITCTDLAVLCATYPETCFSKYGGTPIRGDVCHESVLLHIYSTVNSHP